MMEVIQINLHHAKAASAVLAKTMANRGITVGIVQEPWIGPVGNILGLSQVGNILASCSGDKPRACLVFNRNIIYFPLTDFVTRDVCAAEIVVGGRKTIVASIYFPGDEPDCPPVLAEKLVKYAREQGKDLVMGCDANAHHLAWGSTNINERGESFFDFLLSNDLEVCNEGNKPTFVTLNRREVLDVTVTNSTNKTMVYDWHVSDEPSCSDHRHIRFRLGKTSQKNIAYRSKKATNWIGYTAQLEEERPNSIGRIDTVARLESSVDKLSGTIIAAFENNCPLKVKTLRRETSWWSEKLNSIRKGVRKLFNRAKKTGEWVTYTKELARYNKEIREAKAQSFRRFCDEVSNTSSCCRLQKALASAKSTPIGTIIGENGNMTQSDTETAKVLVKTHFPGSKILIDNQQSTWIERKIKYPSREDWKLAKEICNKEAVLWAISTFKPYKAAGEDGIFPALLQKGANQIAPVLAKIYAGSLALGHIPKLWKVVNVICLHKPGKDRSDPKAYRPISLMSFLLKGMEKIVERHIRDRMVKTHSLNVNQHAYQQGKSTETALSALVEKIECALDDKEICLIAFLDIEGAFNNTTYEAISKALIRFEIEPTIRSWIMSMLDSREIKIGVGGINITASAARGCPQGGVLSPLLWSMVVDDLITLIRGQGVEVIGYADDVAIIVRGRDEKRLCVRMQEALDKIQEWCKMQELQINPKKTVVIPFTRKRKLDNLRPMTVLGEKVEFSYETKYLGVVLDSKLNWKPQVDHIVHRAIKALWTCRRLCGRN